MRGNIWNIDEELSKINFDNLIKSNADLESNVSL